MGAPRDYGNPKLSQIGILALVPDRWGSVWMPRQQILTRLGRYYHTLWVDPQYAWHQLLDATPDDEKQEDDAGYPGFHVHRAPRWLPRVYRPRWLRDLLISLRVRHAIAKLRRLGATKIVAYVWRPELADALRFASADLVVYHIDDEYSFSEVDQPTSEDEQSVIRSADRVLIHSPELMTKKSRYNPGRAVYLPNGVDYTRFSREQPEPADLAALPRPRIGYVGVIKKQLDFQTMAWIAEQRPDVHMVLVGPIGHLGEKAAELEYLLSRKNVHYLGAKKSTELPGYMQHLDVCLMSYVENEYTKFINPLKLCEYLAAGRPVVATPLPSILAAADAVRTAREPREWLSAIDAALSPDGEGADRRSRGRAFAARHDWDLLVQQVANEIATALGNEYERSLIAAI